jgi:O-antigen ligase
LVACFAAVQAATWNGRLFWVYDPPMGGTFPFGPFNNRNYYAGYMIAGLGPVLGLTLAPVSRVLRAVAAAMFGFGALTVLVSQSRGGILALGVATLSMLVAYVASLDGARGAGRRLLAVVVGIALLSVVTTVTLSATGQLEGVTLRLATFANLTDDPSVGGRIEIWRDTLQMIADRPVAGTGLNTFVWAHLPYRSSTTGIPQHAHNEYLEMVAETGLIGGAICLAFLVLLWRTMIREYRRAQTGFEIGLRLGAMASWLGIMIYALTDFPTVIPATNYVLAVLAGLACVPAAEAEGRVAAEAGSAGAGQALNAETPADP